MQETWIYINCEYRQGKDSKPVLGNGKRNCRQNDKAFAPSGTKQELGQHHSGDQQHQAGANTTALLSNLKRQPRDSQSDTVLCHRYARGREEEIGGVRRALLQEAYDVVLTQTQEEEPTTARST